MARKYWFKAQAVVASGFILMCLVASYSARSEVAFVQGADRVQERMAGAEIVAAIRVDTAMDQINLALSKNGNFVSEGVRYNAAVAEVWKGSVPSEHSYVAFNVPLSACYKTLHTATEYLVFTRLDKNGEFQINACSDFVLLSEVPQQYAGSAE